MGKKLAIKGHVSRSKEVVELLKMMGGCESGYSGGVMDCYYYISQFGNIEASYKPYEFDTYIVYTLEEFLEKYPFKVGDKVFLYDNITEGCVTGMEWDENKGTVKYCVYTSAEYWCDVKELLKWNAEFLVNKENENLGENKFPSFEPMFKMNDEFEYKIPDGYEITEVSKNTIFIKPIKSKYPKTYEECAKIMNCPIAGPSGWLFNFDANIKNTYYRKKDILMGKFIRLLIYRDAYWKIAGEEMGLGKPWEPKFGKTILFDITFYFYQDNFMLHKGEYSSSDNCILVFPTEEMRDAFYENFKDLIEDCKELL